MASTCREEPSESVSLPACSIPFSPSVIGGPAPTVRPSSVHQLGGSLGVLGTRSSLYLSCSPQGSGRSLGHVLRRSSPGCSCSLTAIERPVDRAEARLPRRADRRSSFASRVTVRSNSCWWRDPLAGASHRIHYNRRGLPLEGWPLPAFSGRRWGTAGADSGQFNQVREKRYLV